MGCIKNIKKGLKKVAKPAVDLYKAGVRSEKKLNKQIKSKR